MKIKIDTILGIDDYTQLTEDFETIESIEQINSFSWELEYREVVVYTEELNTLWEFQWIKNWLDAWFSLKYSKYLQDYILAQ